jgi:formylglycine-generating enzyme required for sulfatase activity
MVSITLPGKRAFCMDKYSWPNVLGKKPFVNVSWVVAKMDCIEAGKRLCTNEEWTAACKGPKKTSYPYGNTYERRRCADKSDGSVTSGSFPRCGNEFGALDMVGNVWEWVDAKNGDYPLVRGGSYKFGEAANCDMVSPGSVGTRSGEVGFRCCK